MVGAGQVVKSSIDANKKVEAVKREYGRGYNYYMEYQKGCELMRELRRKAREDGVMSENETYGFPPEVKEYVSSTYCDGVEPTYWCLLKGREYAASKGFTPTKDPPHTTGWKFRLPVTITSNGVEDKYEAAELKSRTNAQSVRCWGGAHYE